MKFNSLNEGFTKFSEIMTLVEEVKNQKLFLTDNKQSYAFEVNPSNSTQFNDLRDLGITKMFAKNSEIWCVSDYDMETILDGARGKYKVLKI